MESKGLPDSSAHRLRARAFGVGCGAVAAAVCAATLAAAALAAPPRSPAPQATGRPAGEPVAFLRLVLGQLARNDYARAWRTLHPAHQAVAPLGEYLACERLTPIPGTLERIRVLRVVRRRVGVAGTSTPVAGVAVTFRLRIASRELGVAAVGTHTVHAVRAAGRWAWILPRARYELYRDDACGQMEEPVASPT